jgi:lipopolysaccharide transport system ATP-binding protein
MEDIAIRVDQLHKRYKLGGAVSFSLRETISSLFSNTDASEESKYFHALEDVSFEIKKGDVLGIIGKNGAGKSTLLKILSKITKPTSGRIEINGRVSSLLEVGTGFHPELNGRENIFLNGTILGMRRAEIKSKFEEIVDFSGIEKFIDTPVKYYSSGMYVRLAFAVAAHLEPEILIIDEVLAVGDAEFQKKCLGKMKDVSGSGRTVLFVSHHLAAIQSLCNLGLFLEKGKMLFQGPVGTAINKYLVRDGQTDSNRSKIEGLLNIQDEFIDINSLEIFQDSKPDIVHHPFDSGQAIYLQIKYRVKREVSGLRVGFELHTMDRILIFRTFHDDCIKEMIRVHPGEYTSLANIPANLLAPKEYILSIIVGVHNYRWIVYDTCQLKIDSTGVPSFNRAYGSIHEGILMPLINWENTIMITDEPVKKYLA